MSESDYVEIVLTVGRRRQGFYSDFYRELDAKARAEGRAAGLAEARAEGYAEGYAEGRLESRRSAVLIVLDERGVPVPDATREQILACVDLDLLGTWLRRALTAAIVDDVVCD